MTFRRLTPLLALLLAACAGGSPSGSPSPSPSTGPAASPAPATGVAVTRAFPALTFAQPVDLQSPPDGTNRLFVVEQAGRVKAFRVDAPATAETVLDITDRVLSGGEMGLLGLAFHPDFKTNGYFYVDYVTDGPRRSRISRFTRGEGAGGEQVLLEIPQPYTNHKGGQLQFGPDGFLYVATGDGGSAGDPNRNGQNREALLGKILRLDVNKPANGKPYGLPADNPFGSEVYAYGLRNPWRFSFDKATGKLWAADVGQSAREEIDVVEKGGNYGWNVMEGSLCYGADTCDQTGLKLPVAEYGRDEGQSVTGGYVYRGTAVPGLVGKYVYADFLSKRAWTIDAASPGPGVPLMTLPFGPSSFGVDAQGELYGLDLEGGALYRFTAGS